MKKATIAILAVASIFFAGTNTPAWGCTSILVTPGASTDGSAMITYAADWHELYGELYFTPAQVHAEDTIRDIYEWDSGKFLGRIPQVPRTYQTIGNMNEHQVAITETTFGGRQELKDPEGIMDYGSLIWVALERAKTAREAIRVMTDLVAEHGYYSSGESFSIADPKEVWILEMIGKGPGNKGAVWVAVRIPDGHVAAHANQARIRQFPLNDPKNALYSEDVVSFAREKGWFEGKDEEFSFADTYAPLDFGALRFCEARVYAVYRRVAPSMDFTADYVKNLPGAEPYPLSIKPDKKLSAGDVMALMRDHFQGTELDMTKDVGAGPFKLPYRWRPLTWEVDGQRYFHERAISTQQTGYSLVAQLRSWLPDPIGGVQWFGVDDTASTVYVPIYAGITEVPKSFAVGTGSFTEFTWDAAFWVFNWVANWAYTRYSDMIVDIQKVQQKLEGRFLAEQDDIDQAALNLYKQSPRLAREYLTRYSVSQGDAVTKRWRRLGEELFVKYLDGNVRNELGQVTQPNYCETWRRRLVEDTGDRLKVVPVGEPESE